MIQTEQRGVDSGGRKEKMGIKEGDDDEKRQKGRRRTGRQGGEIEDFRVGGEGTKREGDAMSLVLGVVM